MYVSLLSLRSYRGAVDLDLELAPGVNVLYGVNGAGKTSVLRALATLLDPGELAPSGAPTLSADDLHARLVSDGDAWRTERADEAEVRAELAGSGVTWSVAVRGAGRATVRGRRPWLDALAARVASEDEPWPVLLYLGAARFPEGRLDPEALIAPRRADGWRGALDAQADLGRLIAWWDAHWRRAVHRGPAPAFLAVQRALREALELRDLGYDPELRQLVVDWGAGPVRSAWLSDGQRSFLGVLGEIAWRMETLNPSLGEALCARTPGVVLLDEPDLHLHPSWQRRVVSALSTAFPAVQLVLATQAPLVLGSVPASSAWELTDRGPRRPDALLGAPPEGVLRDVMGLADVRPDAPIVAALRRYCRLVDDGRGHEAAELEAELAASELAEDPAFVRARRRAALDAGGGR